MKKSNLLNHDMWILLLSTIRYSFGRQTYMTSLSWELVIKYEECLSLYQLRQIYNEIMSEVKLYRKLNKRIPDESTWVRGAIRIHRLWRKRFSCKEDIIQ